MGRVLGPERLGQAAGSQGTRQGGGCWGMPRVAQQGRALASPRYLGKGRLGHRAGGDTARAWEPLTSPARSWPELGAGPSAHCEGPRTLREAFARPGAPWEVTRNGGWHPSPRGPSSRTRWRGREQAAALPAGRWAGTGTRTLGHRPREPGRSSRKGHPGAKRHLEHPNAAPPQDGAGRGEGDPAAARGRPCRDWCWPHHGCKDRPQHSATAHSTRRGSDPPIR